MTLIGLGNRLNKHLTSLNLNNTGHYLLHQKVTDSNPGGLKGQVIVGPGPKNVHLKLMILEH